MKKIWGYMALAVSVFFFVMAVHFNMQAQRTAGIATASLGTEALDAVTAQEICSQEGEQEEAKAICIWGEVYKQSLTCRETNGTGSVTAVLAVGNPELIVPGIGQLAWQEGGCFLDTDTAEELFGTENAAGQTVWCQGAPYKVLGTFESLGNTMVRQAAKTDGNILDKVSINLGGDGDANGVMEQFLMRHGLSGEAADFLFLSALIQDFLLLLPLLFCVGLLHCACRQGAASGTFPVKLFWYLLAVGCAAAGVGLVVSQLQVPTDMIPTKWSDFTFWKTWWTRQRKNLLLLLGTAQGELQLSMLWNFLLSFLCNLLAVLLTYFSFVI